MSSQDILVRLRMLGANAFNSSAKSASSAVRGIGEAIKATDKSTKGFSAAIDKVSAPIGAMSALWSAGVRVPEDVSVVGFDDIADAEFASPPLTTVHFDKRAYAAAALDRLVARIEGSTEPATRIAVPARLVQRASTRVRG